MSKEYIDKEDFYMVIDGGFDIDFDETSETKAALLEMIRNYSPADVKPVVRGEWEWLSSTYDREPCHMRYRCSNCRQEVMTHGQKPWEHFCPNCGADMRRGIDAK